MLRIVEDFDNPALAGIPARRAVAHADRLVLALPAGGAAAGADVEAELLRLGLRLHRAYPFSPLRVYILPEADLDATARWRAQLAPLLGDGIVLHEDHVAYPAANVPDDPSYSQQWALANIRAPLGWTYTTGSADAIVAVIDSGLYREHPDFMDGAESNLWVNPDEMLDGTDTDGNGLVDDLYGYDFLVDTGGEMVDTLGHGTKVAGLLGAMGDNGRGIAGVAWRVRILPVRAGASSFSLSTLVHALDYVAELRRRGHPVVAVNNSYGYNDSAAPATWSAENILGQAIERARQAGLLFVAAAGNNGQDSDAPFTQHFYPSDATHANVISVAAINSSDNLWPGSNRGAVSVDLAAPGQSVLTTLNTAGYGSDSGTSYASPHVAGAAALIAALRPDVNYAWMRELILRSVRPLPSLAGKVASGGTLDLAELLERASLPLPLAWQRGFWSAEEVGAEGVPWAEDADLDGWDNLMELAFGGHPLRPGAGAATWLHREVLMPTEIPVAGFSLALRFNWSPLGEGLVERSWEQFDPADGGWIPVEPLRESLIRDDPASGLRTYEASFPFNGGRQLIRMRLGLSAGE